MNDIRSLLEILDNVHLRVPKLSKTAFCGSSNDFFLVQATLSMHINSGAANAIDRSLRKLHSTIDGMHGFLVSVFYPFGNEDHAWPVVQWTEGEDKEGLAIFEVDTATNICSWIIHRGVRTENDNLWKDASIEWTVTEIGHLKTLFYAAQHLLGILEWSTKDCHNIYCEAGFGNYSPEEYEPPEFYSVTDSFQKRREICTAAHPTFFENRKYESGLRSGRGGVREQLKSGDIP